jgi:hypothetical protein
MPELRSGADEEGTGRRFLLGRAARAWLVAAVALMLALSSACSDDTATERGADAAATVVVASSEATLATPAAAAGPRTVSMNALAFSRTAAGAAQGSASVFTVTVAPKAEPAVQVSFTESEVGGQGPAIRAAGWTAVTSTALLLGIDPARYEFRYEMRGRVDGPSAGALMTIGTLAAILGDELPKDVAMTGAINPDGSIGPVSGIPHKIDGAAAAGMKTVLIPAGQRMDYDENLKRSVDLVRRGEQQGVQVKPVANVWEAYQAATGKALPQPKGAAQAQLPAPVYDRMLAARTAWLARYSDARARFGGYSPDVQDSFVSEMEAADDLADLSAKAAREGNAAVALERAIGAAQYAVSANGGALVLQTYYDRGLSRAIAQAEGSLAARTAVSGLLERLRVEQPKTASDAIGLIDAYGNYAIAEAMIRQGEARVAALNRDAEDLDEDEIVEGLLDLTDSFVSAELFAGITRTSLDLYLGRGTAAAPSPATLAGLAEVLRRAAEANVAAFDATVVAEIAEEAGLREDVTRARLARLDPDYALLVATAGALGGERQAARPEQSLYQLGAALNAYTLSTVVLAKYYSLDAEFDDDFRVTGYGREAALLAMLELSERRAADLAGLSADVPLPALYYLENARAYRHGDAQEKLTALYYNWQASLFGQFLASMTGEYGASIQGTLDAAGRPAAFLRSGAWRP